MNRVVLSLLAHPDDAEFMCASTLALLQQKGWEIHIATMTPGDCGTATHSREEISQIRTKEAANAAVILDGTYYCLGCDDVFIMYDKPTLLKAIELIRKVKPTIVFAPSPQDYMVDHEITSKIVMTACFSAGMPNVKIGDVDIYEFTPHLYYVDPLESKDIFGNKILPSTYVDVTSVMDIKEKMLCCHTSQRDWLLKHHGMDEYVESMKRHAHRRGNEIDISYAEAFRQHMGHGYPHINILKDELKELVIEQ